LLIKGFFDIQLVSLGWTPRGAYTCDLSRS